VNSQRTAIITDSGTDTPASYIERYDIRVIPLHINYSDGSSLKSGVDITGDEVIDRFEQEIPKTSLPSPEEILETLRQAAADGYEKALVITISAGLSATNQTARLMAAQVEGIDARVIDTKNIGIGAGLAVMRAAELLEQGMDVDEVEGKVLKDVEGSAVFFSTKNIDFLYKGGRISGRIYRIGKVLDIKPVITCTPDDGHYEMAKKCRGWKRALEAMVSLVAERAVSYGKVRVAICCTKACPLFEELEAKVREAVPNVTEFVRSGVSADLLVHVGPELVGMAVQPA